MSDLVRTNPLRWPYSLAQLREDEPTKSFSPSPSKAEYAHFDVYHFEDVVTLVEPPPVDPATHRLEQRPPAEVDGVLTQQWEVVELTLEEQEAYYRATHPPRWIEFWAALPDDVDELLNDARAVKARLGASLEVGLGQAANGDSRVFLQAWQGVKTLGLVTPELATGVQMLATQYDLPAEFVGGLG